MRVPLPLLNAALRLVEKTRLRRARDVARLRRGFERNARLLFRDPPLAAYLPDRLGTGAGAVPALWSIGRGAQGPGAILYFHGGAHVFGSPRTHRAMLAAISEGAGIPAILPDYHLAPEHPFPAGPDDALAAYRALLARGYAAQDIVLGGDSSGGGLALGLLHAILAQGLPPPAGLFAIGPWTDLTLSGDSLRRNAATDSVLPAERVAESRDMVLQGADPHDPRISPLFGRFTGAPPVLILVSDSEILLDDSRRMADRLHEHGVAVTLELGHDLPHVWPILQSWLAEADRAIARIARFIREVKGLRPPRG